MQVPAEAGQKAKKYSHHQKLADTSGTQDCQNANSLPGKTSEDKRASQDRKHNLGIQAKQHQKGRRLTGSSCSCVVAGCITPNFGGSGHLICLSLETPGYS